MITRDQLEYIIACCSKPGNGIVDEIIYDLDAITNEINELNNQQTCETCNMCGFCSQSVMQEIEYPGAWEEVSINGCSYHEPKSQEILELIKKNKQKEQS